MHRLTHKCLETRWASLLQVGLLHLKYGSIGNPLFTSHLGVVKTSCTFVETTFLQLLSVRISSQLLLSCTLYCSWPSLPVAVMMLTAARNLVVPVVSSSSRPPRSKTYPLLGDFFTAHRFANSLSASQTVRNQLKSIHCTTWSKRRWNMEHAVEVAH